MNPYKRLTHNDRVKIATMSIFNVFQHRIAQEIGCTQSAISQEISRNSVNGVYDNQQAQKLADSRKTARKKPVLDNSETVCFIVAELKKRRSPEQISELAKRQGIKVSTSSIYNYIQQNSDLKKFKKHKKYRKRSQYKASKHGIPDRVSISARPEAVNNREEFGHLEIDFVISPHGSRACVLSGRERKTRYPFFIKLDNKTELKTTEAIKSNLLLKWVKSFSTDNDKSLEVNRADFINAVNLVSTYSDDKLKAIKIEIEGNKIRITAARSDALAEQELDIVNALEPMVICFNAKYLNDISALIKSENLVIKLNNSASPALIKQADINSEVFVIMPMRI